MTRPTVLVVDDHPLLRDLLVRELHRHYRVVTAEDLARAIELIVTCDLAAVVTDLELPGGGDGLAILDHARRARPGCARVLVSGSTDDALIAASLRCGIAQRFVAKPWRLGAVVGAVRALLASPAIVAAAR